MSSDEQVAANRENAKHSTGPGLEARARTRFNAVKHGLRAKTLILPGEDPQEFESGVAELMASCRPRDETEETLVLDAARARWMRDRADRASNLRLDELVEQAEEREEIEVHRKIKRLFRDPRGPHGLYALTSADDGGPRTSQPEKPKEEEEYDPFVLVKELEGTARGCEALLAQWRELRERVELGLDFQATDRLKAIRMLGKQPLDAVEDKRIIQIYVGSFALNPFGRTDAYEDLKADTRGKERKLFLRRVRSRWPLVLDASETAKAKQTLLDLIATNVAGLEAKLKRHLERTELYKARTAARFVYNNSQDGQALARLQLAWDRRYDRRLDGYWKHRERVEGGGWSVAGGGEWEARGPGNGLLAEDQGEEAARDGSAEGVWNLASDSGWDAGSAGAAEKKNVTNEANSEEAISEVSKNQEVTKVAQKTGDSFDDILAQCDVRNERVGAMDARGSSGRRAIEEAIFARGPLLRVT